MRYEINLDHVTLAFKKMMLVDVTEVHSIAIFLALVGLYLASLVNSFLPNE